MWQVWIAVCAVILVSSSSYAQPAFGKDMRSEFYFDEGLIFLNHGSFGATPKMILDHEFSLQIQMERNTMNWMKRTRIPLLDENRHGIAQYANARVEDTVIVVDATSAINAVFRSIQFQPGDKILYLDTVYGAVAEMFKLIKYANDVTLIQVPVPFPLSGEQEIIDVITEQFQIHDNIRIALFSHITSPTSLILPVKELITLAHSYGTQVFIDGAHSVGQIPLNITDINADYYCVDIHKWLCGPKGAGVLWVKPEYHSVIVPTSISSGASGGYIAAFEWTGTLDFSAYLSINAAIDWRNYIGGDEVVQTYNNNLCNYAGSSVALIWGTTYPSLAPTSMFASLSVVELPSVAYVLTEQQLQDQLFANYQIEIVFFTLGTTRYTRMSCHVYNYEEEYLTYAQAVMNLTSNFILNNPRSTMEEISYAKLELTRSMRIYNQLYSSLQRK